jgi:hypothetical protein
MGEQDQMQRPNGLALYEQRLLSLWERLVMALGIYTVRVLLDRAIGQTAQRHPDIALIVHNSGLSFEDLEKRYATRPREEIEAAFNDLVAEMLHILARLLGREMAQRLAEDLAVKDTPTRPRGPRRAPRQPRGPRGAQEDLAVQDVPTEDIH